MKILMVTPYPPERDGIAAYAVQSVAKLRAEGHDVTVLSPGPSAAHQHLHLRGSRGTLALAKRVRRYDKVIIQFHPDVFYPVPVSPGSWAQESLALAVTLRLAHQVEVRIHEIDYGTGRWRGLTGMASRLPWRLASKIVVHTDKERDDFAAAFRVSPKRIVVTRHGADFRPRTAMGRPEARASLGLNDEEIVFLAIGFIQPHKGFDRAVRAFGRLGLNGRRRPSCRLDVVGSVRTDDPGFVNYFEELDTLVRRTPGTHLHEGYVSDELFDRWIVAADVVVLPYRAIWSSGVLERAALLGRPVIATDVGGLAHQRHDREAVTLVHDDEGLMRAMRSSLDVLSPGRIQEPRENLPWLGPGVPAARETIQGEIQRRAAAQRGSDVSQVIGGPNHPVGSSRPFDASAPVRRLPALGLPAPVSARLGASILKRVVLRLTAWEVEPLTHQINALREATIRALER